MHPYWVGYSGVTNTHFSPTVCSTLWLIAYCPGDLCYLNCSPYSGYINYEKTWDQDFGERQSTSSHIRNVVCGTNSHKSGRYVSEPSPPYEMNLVNGGNTFEIDSSVESRKNKPVKNEKGLVGMRSE